MENKGTPRDFFLYLTLIVALYSAMVSFTSLVFDYINYWLPNSVTGYTSYPDLMAGYINWSIAVLVVVVPILFWVSSRIENDLSADAGKFNIRSRKWFLHTTLFITGAVVAGDLVFLLYNYLNGELLRDNYVSKSGAILVIAGLVFTHYLNDLKRQGSARIRNLVAIGAVTVLTIANIAIGVSIVGTPGYQRNHKLDKTRISNLQNLDGAVKSYYREKNSFPSNLEDLSKSSSQGLSAYDSYYNYYHDPQSREPYAYKVLSPTSFQLCANFATEQRQSDKSYYSASDWSYKPGTVCFDRKVN